MYTKIKIEFDGKEIVFGAHEVVKIAQAVMKREMENCLGTEHSPQIQDHELYVASLNKRLSSFSSILFQLYENKYNFMPGVIKQFLDEIRAADNNSFMITGLMTVRWKQLLDISKTKKEADKEFVGFAGKEVTKGFLPIPPVIKGLNSQANFYFLIKHLAKEVAKPTFNGWWVLIAGRVIHINYQPVTAEGERGQHYYVSDHGTLDNVTDQITNVTLRHKLFADENHWDLMMFFEAFDRLDIEKKTNLRENFINFIRGLNLEDEELIEFLLVTCSLERGLTIHNWKVFEEKWPVAHKKYREFHGKFIDKPKAESIIDDEYKKCEAAYEVTLERARYKTHVRLIPSIKEKYTGTVYSTQVGNVMTKNDADTFMECKFLTGLAGEVSLGDRSKLLRPVGSYGDRHSGSSYHDFERALVNYQARPTHLNDAQLAVLMRRVLAGETPSLPYLNFVPNLAGAWFIAESVRNPTAFLSGVILLDMIENGVQLLDTSGNNWYSFRNSLVHPLKSSRVGKVTDLYGSKINIDLFGGSHPMAHGGSVSDAQEERRANTKLTPVRQKEANLIIHWMNLYLKQLGITSHLISEKLEIKDVNFDELATEDKDSPKLEQLKKKAEKLEATIRIKKKDGKDTTDDERKLLEHKETIKLLTAKQEVQRSILEEAIKARLNSLENLLGKTHGLAHSTEAAATVAVAVADESIIDAGTAAEEELPPLEMLVTPERLVNLTQEREFNTDILVIDSEQRKKQGLDRSKEIRKAAKARVDRKDTSDITLTKLMHIETIADGNCAFNSFALGLLHHQNFGRDNLINNREFRKVFAEIFLLDPSGLTAENFEIIFNALLSRNLNINNDIIKSILEKLENIEEVKEGSEHNQLLQRLNMLRGRVLKEETFSGGNIKAEYRELGIRCLAERGELFQLVMAIALRKYCVQNKGADLIELHPGTEAKVEAGKLDTSVKFGDYAGNEELNFLAHKFGIKVSVKLDEFGGWANYGPEGDSITVFCVGPGKADCHYELLLGREEAFLERRLNMDEKAAPFTSFVASNLVRAFQAKSGLGLY